MVQDDKRVRAWAGAALFRLKGRLKDLQTQAHEQVERLKREVAHDPEHEGRIAQTLRRMLAMEGTKQANGKPVDSARLRHRPTNDGDEAMADTSKLGPLAR